MSRHSTADRPTTEDNDATPVRRRARSGEPEQLRELFAQEASSPALLARNFHQLSKVFARLERNDLFLDLLLAKAPQTFRRLGLITSTFKIAREMGRESEVFETISRLQSISSMPHPAWGIEDHLGNTSPLGPRIAQELALLKYQDAPDVHKDLFESAHQLSRRLIISRKFLLYLRGVSRFTSIAAPDWEQHVCTAVCLDQIVADAQGRTRPQLERELGFSLSGSFDHLVDQEAVDTAFGRLSGQRGALVLTYHGGFLTFTKGLFHKAFPEGVRMQAAPSTSGASISVKDDHRAALFRAVRLLQDGGRLLMAPDAGAGKKTFPIEVAGTSVHVSEGAAFLAYESECETAWFTVVREGERFMPLLVPGPVRQAGERFGAYKARLLHFYAEQLTAMITGEPWNLALRTRWVRTLSSARSGPP